MWLEPAGDVASRERSSAGAAASGPRLPPGLPAVFRASASLFSPPNPSLRTSHTHQQVYNLTSYLRFHPGGVPLLLKVAGKDGTALFNKYHAWVRRLPGGAAMEYVCAVR